MDLNLDGKTAVVIGASRGIGLDWNLEAGGPRRRREERPGRPDRSFLFPQMKMGVGASDLPPNFVDYLFLSFTTSANFVPADTPILSRWVKALTMVQVTLSLSVVILLVARALGTL